MRFLLLFISVLFLFPQSVYAERGGNDLEVLCRHFTLHTPNADVAYQPGIDVRGQAVVSADLEDNRLEVHRVFTIPLRVEQLEALNMPTDSVLAPELSVGEVVVDLDADSITFNGQEIKQNDLEVLCLKPEYEEKSE